MYSPPMGAIALPALSACPVIMQSLYPEWLNIITIMNTLNNMSLLLNVINTTVGTNFHILNPCKTLEFARVFHFLLPFRSTLFHKTGVHRRVQDVPFKGYTTLNSSQDGRIKKEK